MSRVEYRIRPGRGAQWSETAVQTPTTTTCLQLRLPQRADRPSAYRVAQAVRCLPISTTSALFVGELSAYCETSINLRQERQKKYAKPVTKGRQFGKVQLSPSQSRLEC